MSRAVDRYMLQLRSLLPRRQRDDVAAEIFESISAAIEERRRELGRELDDAEAREILKSYGHPVALAGRYLPVQQLIGPRVFPLYWYAIRAVLTVIAAIGVIVAAIALLTEPRATQATVQVLVRFFWIALEAAALVTLLFALLDRRGFRLELLDKLEASEPDSRPLGEIPRSDTVIELAMVSVLLLWWIGWLSFPTVQFDVKVELGSGARALYAPVIALCIIDIARLVVDFVLPYRTAPRIGGAIVSNVVWLILFAIGLSSYDLLQAAPSIQNPEEIGRVVATAENVFRALLLGLGVWTLGDLVVDVRRLLRPG
jgi:hypothetical protein